MYSAIKNVQILIALLKEYGFKHVVISPGGNNIPVIHSIESDQFFNCYSVVDERSAAYFAMGLAQQLEETVVLVCTSGTAVCNYLPGITEAHYQRVPLVVITTDRSPYMLEQLETQKIDQMHIFGSVVNKDVNLPQVKNEDDAWYCSRLINEAFIELFHHAIGPVHINVPTNGGSPLDYSCLHLPKVNKINLIKQNDLCEHLDKLSSHLKNKKILVVLGENFQSKNDVCNSIEFFCEKYGAVCLKDYISNYDVNGILSYRVTESFREEDFKEELGPDIVITTSNNILSNNLKYFLRSSNLEHWAIDEGGQIRDVFKKLTYLFECDEKYFFNSLNSLENVTLNKDYQKKWQIAKENTKFDKLEYSDLKVVERLINYIPNDSVVHTAILNSTRAFHLFESNKKIKVYSNIGALGIDGCLSTFVGHSFATSKLCFLVIGDLSFFYDMNALGIHNINSNARIMLLNNGGGAEFHFNMGKDNIPSINDFISVKHEKIAKGWAETLNFKYLSANNIDEVNLNMEAFVGESNQPIIFEVFTDMERDAKIVKKALNSICSSRSNKSKFKNIVKTALGKNG